MSGLSDLIDVFKMQEIKPEMRIRLIKKLGVAINNEHGMNLTDEVVEELVFLIENEPKY